MTDYLLIKLSEMALRAIRAPKGPLWKITVLTPNREVIEFDQLPISIKVYNQYHRYALVFNPGVNTRFNGSTQVKTFAKWCDLGWLCDAYTYL